MLNSYWGGVGVGLIFLLIGYLAKLLLGEGNGLSQICGPLFVAALTLWSMAVFVAGVIALYRVVMAMYNGRKALDAGESVAEYKAEIHYTLPLAFPIGVGGLTPYGIVVAFGLGYVIYKWGLPLYKWADVKPVLLHRGGTTWKCTLLTWVNFLFFIISSFYPILVVSLILLVVLILYKTGILKGAFNGLFGLWTNTMNGAGSSAGRTCASCAHFTGYSCSLNGLGASSNDASCRDFQY